jgi:hypothetical protein
MASPKTAAVASVHRASSSPSFPRSSGDAGEAVEVVRPVSSVLASLAGRGGEERSWRLVVIRFWCFWWSWSPSSASLLRPAVVATGVGVWSWLGAGGGWPGRQRVGWLFGGSGEQALWSCSFIVLGFRRAAADGSAVFYKVWRRFLPGGRRYGNSGVV